MKKIVILLVLAALLTGGAFAQMNVGGGVLFDMSLGNGMKFESGSTSLAELNINNTTIGAFVFFDYTFVEVDLSFGYGMFSMESKVLDEVVGDVKLNGFQLGVSVLGKYPIDLGMITLFPLIGINYNMVLSLTIEDGAELSDAGDYSQFGLLAGLGLDFPLSDSLFIRAEALFQLRLSSKEVNDALSSDWKATLGLGPRIKVGVGFKM